MWLTRRRLAVAAVGLVILLVGVPVIAASTDFFSKAQQWHDKECPKPNPGLQRSLFCYLFEKVGELNTQLGTLTGRVGTLESSLGENTQNDQVLAGNVQGLEASQGNINATLAENETRLKAVEAALHTHSPSPSPSPTPPSNCAAIVNSQPIVGDDFNGYINGSIVGQGGWQSYVNGDHFVVQGDTVFEGVKALHNSSFGDSVVGKQGTPRADGKQSVCFRTENRGDWGFYSADGNVGVRVSKGLNASGAPGLSFASVSLKSDGNVAYYDQVADVYRNFATYNDNEWTLLEIEWRSSDKTTRYRVNSGTWTDWKPFANAASFTGFDYVNFGFVLPSGSGGVYFDTLQ